MESLFDLIQSLEPGLTDVKISSQRESIETLISGLKNIPISSITCKEIDHLVDFLSDRLAIADPNITNLILDGFIWLTKSVGSNGCSMISAEQAERIVQHGIFGHLSIQSLTKSGRLKVFQLLHCFLTGSQLVGIQSMKSTFVRNYLVAIDGEKDPQILQLIFHMNVLVINNFPSVDEFKDEIFETTSIYFPIDFSPPPGGGVAGITRDMLVSGLHQCLFAMRNMTGHNLMPLICEKIESDWSDGQLDALRLLTDCLHGRLLHVTNHDNNHMLSDGNPIDIRHISPYLAVIIPALITIANKMGKRRNKTDLYPLVLSCISGLVYAYSKQTSEKFQLEDFALILLRSFGLSFTDTNNCQSPVLIPSSTIVAYITESFKSAQNNILLSSILFSYIIPRVCVPLLSDSCLIFQHLVPKEDIKDHLEELLNWQPCISLLNKIFLCVTEDHLISALHYDKHIMKTLKVVKQNASIIIPQLREYIMTTPSLSEIFSERILHFSICTCRLSYSIIKYSAMMPCIPATNNSFDSFFFTTDLIIF
ncbi:unnamed protein product [Heterobilharzia americana]|nr:unnamed protein product [Heterobilharzia americana]